MTQIPPCMKYKNNNPKQVFNFCFFQEANEIDKHVETNYSVDM